MQLGFENTVQEVVVDGIAQYLYKVGNKTFQTKEVIYNSRTNSTLGRATRVWKVVEAHLARDKNAPVYVLKDLYMSAHNETEWVILSRICRGVRAWKAENPTSRSAAAARDPPTLEQESLPAEVDHFKPDDFDRNFQDPDFRRYFTVPIVDMKVPLSSMDKASFGKSTYFQKTELEKLRTRPSYPPPAVTKPLRKPLHSPHKTEVVGAIPVQPIQGWGTARSRNLTQYRIGFEGVGQDVGKDLTQLKDLKSIFEVLRDVAVGTSATVMECISDTD